MYSIGVTEGEMESQIHIFNQATFYARLREDNFVMYITNNV